MERLIFSNPIPFKTQLKSRHFLPRLGRFHAAKLRFSSSSRTEFRRLNTLSCKHEDHSSRSSSSSSTSPINYSVKTSSSVSSPVDSETAERASHHQKAVSAGIVILGSIAAILLHTIVASPAFASFQTTSKTGGPAAAALGRRLLRTELLSSAWTGFFAGCLHTLSGPDHLAALAPLSIGRTRLESAAVGALWGCGHDAGQLIFGLLFLLLKDRLHIEVLRTWGTRVVGFTLLLIGAMGIKEASEVPAPCVALENGECDVGVYGTLENPNIGRKKIGFATFATGIVHGLQPDALLIILPALALPSRLAGAAFLGMFLIGTVTAMGGYTVFIGSCSQALKERVPRITEKLTWASSLIAIALGFAMIISQFFGFSLY
ncbi:chloroplast protein FOR GROWTH AND FERTILITY 2-like [Cornus florida]|uniref:chloroplast protein FOR GROWTH AND FERTILITY 2-like n=1 Tax=Cornus florida TaxID=4283 RepID=UPI00289AEE75|nr:chloroplast protein FOR GROWTH AND FERTILITY 2-like [Cornus florida]